jgi:histidinol phosphatase-like PHP family hydrolase
MIFKYKNYFKSGDWHVHTNYVDGKNTVFEMCEQAKKNNLKLIAFTEHIRRKHTYSFEHYINDIKKARKQFDLVILAGIESKIIDKYGNLDVTEDILSKCDIVIGVFHDFEIDVGKYLNALRNMIIKKQIDIWGHPTYFLRKNSISIPIQTIKDIFLACKENNIIIEKNLKYQTPGPEYMKLIEELGINYVISTDAHSTNELRKIYEE